MGSYAYPEEDLMFTNNLLSYKPGSFQQATELDYTIESPHALKEPRYCVLLCVNYFKLKQFIQLEHQGTFGMDMVTIPWQGLKYLFIATGEGTFYTITCLLVYLSVYLG